MAKKYIYRNGDECTDLTGGWVKGGYNRGSATLTKNADNMTLQSTASGNQTATAITTNKIDVTNYKKICFNVEYSLSNAANGQVNLGIISSNANADFGQNTCATYLIDDVTSFSGIAEVDLTNVTGEWYVVACEDRWTSGTATLIIREVWLEYDGDRIFQPGIVGKTNVVEGAVIPVKPKTQYLFNYGDTCDEITGGWGLKQNWSNYPNGTGGVVDNYLYSADEGSNYGNGQMATKNMIDMRGYSKLYAIISCVATKSGSYNCSCSVAISKEDYNYNSSWGTNSASVYTTLADAGWNTSSGATSVENLLVEIDISEIDEGLVWFKTWSGSLNSHTAKGKCYAIWMEP